MNDPQHLSPGDWLSAMAAGMITGIGGAMAWFNGTKKQLETRMDTIEERHAAQTTEFAVMVAHQEHMTQRMDEVRELVLLSHRKLDEALVQTRRD